MIHDAVMGHGYILHAKQRSSEMINRNLRMNIRIHCTVTLGFVIECSFKETATSQGHSKQEQT